MSSRRLGSCVLWRYLVSCTMRHGVLQRGEMQCDVRCDGQVATPEGVVRDLPESNTGTEGENGYGDAGKSNGHAGVNGASRGRGGPAQRESGWVPSSSNGVEVGGMCVRGFGHLLLCPCAGFAGIVAVRMR